MSQMIQCNIHTSSSKSIVGFEDSKTKCQTTVEGNRDWEWQQIVFLLRQEADEDGQPHSDVCGSIWSRAV